MTDRDPAPDTPPDTVKPREENPADNAEAAQRGEVRNQDDDAQ